MGATVGTTAAAVSVSGGPVEAGAHLAATNGLRLTPQTLTAVPIGNFTDLAEIFWTPYKSTQIALLTAGTWAVRSTAQITIDVTGGADLIPADLFAFWNGVAVAVESLDWTNVTTRATALVRQDGVWVKTGDVTRRYIGTVFLRGAAGTTLDWVTSLDLNGAATPLRMDIWNFSNRVRIGFTMRDTGGDFVWTDDAWRQWRGDINAQVEVISGIQEECCTLTGYTSCMETASGNRAMSVGFGHDGVVTPDVDNLNFVRIGPTLGGVSASLIKQATLGAQFFGFMQHGTTAADITTWLAADAFGFNGSWVA